MPSKVTGNPLRRQHRALVLGQLRAHGPMPKGEVASRLGLSIPTVAEILARFEAEGLVEPVGVGESSGGRRPTLFGLRMDGLRAVGVNVDLDRISVVLSDLSGEVQAEAAVAHDLGTGQADFVATLQKIVAEVLREPGAGDRLAGIGIALPTTIPRSGSGLFVPDVSGHWPGVDLSAVLGDRFQLPVVVENRGHAVGVGEYLFGAGRGSPNLLCMMLGTGLGGSIIDGGRLFTGGDGGSGVFGRMRMGLPDDTGAPPAQASDLVRDKAIVSAAGESLTAAGRDALGDVPLDRIDVDQVIDHALNGDAELVEVLARVGRVLGAVAAAALCVADSELILLCGPTMRAGALIVDPFTEILGERAPFTVPAIRVGELGIRAGTLGAAALVLTDFVHDIRISRPTAAG